MKKLLQRLDELAELEDKWDSYGAAAPALKIISVARQFIYKYQLLDLPFYFVSAAPNGEILLEFQRVDRAIEIYFVEGERVECFYYVDNNLIESNKTSIDIQKMLKFFHSDARTARV